MRYLLILIFINTLAFGQKISKLDSLKFSLKSLRLNQKSIDSDSSIISTLCQISDIYRIKKKDSSLIYSFEALKLSEKKSFKKGQISAHIAIANYYSIQSLSVKSIENYLKALAIAEDIKDFQKQIFLTLEIGNDYLSLEDYKNSKLYFLKNNYLSKKNGTFENYIFSINSLGILYFEQKDLKTALKFFLVCEKASLNSNNATLINLGLINTAKVYTELKEFDEAIKRYQKALYIEDGYKDRKSFIYNELALISSHKKRYSEALVYAKMSLESATSLNKNSIKNVSLTLSKIYDNLGLKSKAYLHFKVYNEISLSQDSIKNSQLVRFMNLDYLNEKQIVKIEGLNNEVKVKEKQNLLLLISILGAITISIITFYFYNSIKKKNKLIEIQKTQIQSFNNKLEVKIEERTQELSEANAELIKKNFEITEALFKGQTIERKRVAAELHDNLGSTLSALKWRLGALNSESLLPKEKEIYESIKTMMGSAYEEVRHISHNLMPAEFERYGLVGALEKLVKEINDGNTLSLLLKTDGDIASLEQKLSLEIYSICLELLNNTLKHAKASVAKLYIRKNKHIEIVMEDNGIGFSDKTIPLRSLKARVDSQNGEMRIEYVKGKGLKVEINLKNKLK